MPKVKFAEAKFAKAKLVGAKFAKARIAKAKFDKYSTFSTPVQRAIVNTLFRGSLGPKAQALIKNDPVDWNAVADEYLDSNEFRKSETDSMARRARMGTKKLAQPDTNIHRRMSKNAERFKSAAITQTPK